MPCALTVCPCAELVGYFRAQMHRDPGMASAVAAIRTLLEFLKRDQGEQFGSGHFCLLGTRIDLDELSPPVQGRLSWG